MTVAGRVRRDGTKLLRRETGGRESNPRPRRVEGDRGGREGEDGEENENHF